MKSEVYIEGCISIVALLLFLNSIFPVSNYTPPRNETMQTYLREPKYHRTVLLVLDGLRFDYIEKKSNVPNISFFLQDPTFEGCLVRTIVKVPTTTLPAVKALTTGVPSKFIDVMYNFGKENNVIDSIIHQMYNFQKRVLFYGDEVWQHLFSPLFHRSEAFFGFQIYDFDSMDTLITNHIRNELPKKDWDVLIAHYPGLDHIGHVETPSGASIQRKLKEYDSLVTEILTNLQNWEKDTGQKSLFIITGDHGMLNSGNHGGAETDETEVPSIFFGLPCEKNTISMLQIDFAPLLTILLGVPIPSTSIAKIVPELFKGVTENEKFPIYREYFNTLLKLYQFPKEVLNDIKVIAAETQKFDTSSTEYTKSDIIGLYEKGIRLMSNYLAHLNEMDLYASIFAMLILISSLLVLVLSLLEIYLNRISTKRIVPSFYTTLIIIVISVFGHNGICWAFENSCSLCFASDRNNKLVLILQGLYFSSLGYNLIKIQGFVSSIKIDNNFSMKYLSANKSLIVFFIAFMCRGVLFIGQSFMINDQSILFYFCSTAMAYIVYDLVFLSNREKSRKNILLHGVLSLVLIRLSKENFNQLWTIESVKYFQGIFFIFFMLGSLYFNKKYFGMNRITTFWYGLTLMSIFVYRVALNNDLNIEILFSVRDKLDTVLVARFSLVLIFITCGTFINDKLHSTSSDKKLDIIIFSWLLLNTLLLRPYNIPSLLVVVYLSRFISRFWTKALTIKIIMIVWIGNICFYSQGNSDQLTTVDVLIGLIGQRTYSIFLAPIFIIIPLYSAPILAYLLLRKDIESRQSLYTFKAKKKEQFSESVVINYLFFLHHLSLIIQLGVLILVNNTHWFLWTLFAPKLLYFSLNLVVFLLCMVVI